MDSVFGPIFDGIGFLLSMFYSVIPNLGVAIVLLTITIMFVLYPLTAKQTRSMMAMQRVQPEIKKLQAKYKNDRQKLNEEMMKFYQENKINPLAGCLPLLVQMPVLISLFSVLRSAYKYVPTSSKLYEAFCHGLSKVPKDGTPHFPDCGTVLKASQLDNPGVPKGLVKGDTLLHHLHFLGLDLQKSATAKHDGLMDAAPYFILVILVIVTYVLQSRQSAKRTPAANKQMGALMKILPPFFGLISVTLPSGLVIYLFVSALFRLGQQEVIFRRHGSALHGPGGRPLEVKSTDRTKAATATALADPIEDDEPPPEKSAQAGAGPAPAPARTPTGERAGGLRGMFALPPPPESNGGAGSGGSASGRPSGSGSGGGRASQPRRRNKKKRKR